VFRDNDLFRNFDFDTQITPSETPNGPSLRGTLCTWPGAKGNPDGNERERDSLRDFQPMWRPREDRTYNNRGNTPQQDQLNVGLR
jgi:hypothetical protein